MLSTKVIYSSCVFKGSAESLEEFTLRVNREANKFQKKDLISISYVRMPKLTEIVAIISYYKVSIVSLIVAKTDDNIIGKNGKIPWKCADDMKLFKELTMGNVVIMGRKTFESIGSKPLPGRENIVITSNPSPIYYDHENGLTCYSNLEVAINESRLQNEGKEIFIIGGSSLYKEALNKDYVHRMYISNIRNYNGDGDTYFPKLEKDCYNIIKYTPTGATYLLTKRDCFYEKKNPKKLEFIAEQFDRILD